MYRTLCICMIIWILVHVDQLQHSTMDYRSVCAWCNTAPAADDEMTISMRCPTLLREQNNVWGPQAHALSSTKHSYWVTAWSLLTEVTFEPKKVVVLGRCLKALLLRERRKRSKRYGCVQAVGHGRRKRRSLSPPEGFAISMRVDSRAVLDRVGAIHCCFGQLWMIGQLHRALFYTPNLLIHPAVARRGVRAKSSHSSDSIFRYITK